MKKTILAFVLFSSISEITFAQKGRGAAVMQKPAMQQTQVPALSTVPAAANTGDVGTIASTSFGDNLKNMNVSILINSATMKRPDGTTMRIRAKAGNEQVTESSERTFNTDRPGTQAAITEGNENTLCTVEYKKLSALSIDQDVLNDNLVNNLVLGGAFSLNDLQRQGRFNIINTGINPIRLQINAGVQDNQITVNNPDAASLSQALNQLKLRTATVKPAINGYFEFSEVHSQQELALKVGFNFSTVGIKVDDKFNFNQSSDTRKLLLDFRENTFSVKAFPDNTNYFNAAPANGVTDIVYIDKMTYGKRVLVFFETTDANLQMSNALQVNVSSGFTDVNANIDAATKQKLSTVQFKAISYGTTKSLNIVVTGIDQLRTELNKYFNEINNVGLIPDQWGKPISYSLKYLNGDIAVTSATVENLPRRSCQPNPDRPVTVNLNLKRIDTRDDADLFGHVHVRYYYADGTEITNTSTPGNVQIWGVSEEAHYTAGVPKVFENTSIGVRITMQNIIDGAYCRISGNLNDYDSGSGNDYLGIRETTGPAYRDVRLINVLTNCNKANGKNDCKFILEAAESDGSCTFNFDWSIN
jgi:Thiol-activated cytolysin